MKMMKTITQNILRSVLFFSLATFAIIARAQSSTVKQAGPAQPVSVETTTNSFKLVAFTAALNNNKVEVKFATVLENNLSHVIVERSIDGTNFNDAALVFAYGNTTERSDYMFPDNISKIKSTILYYRLKIVNGDGTVQYSDVRIVKINREQSRDNIVG